MCEDAPASIRTARRLCNRGQYLGQYQIFAALAVVFALAADIYEWHEPSIRNGPKKNRAVNGPRQFQHDRPVVLRIEEEIEVTHARVDGQRLVLPTGPFWPPDDIVVIRLRITEVRLTHRVEAHNRLAPNRGVHGTAVDCPFGQLLG